MQVPWTFRVSGILRLLAAGVGVAALVANFQYVLGFSTFATLNYFSYFTQQSNMANVVVLVVSGLLTLRGRLDPPWFAAVHAIVTTYVMVSGIVFAVIVTQSASHHYSLAFPASSQILHFWISGYVLLDWIFAPGRTPVRWRMLSVVLVFPVIWGVFTLLRGRAVRWYPYFFLDPAQVSPGQFRLYNALVLVIFLGVLAALIGLSHVRPWHRARLRDSAGSAGAGGERSGGTGPGRGSGSGGAAADPGARSAPTTAEPAPAVVATQVVAPQEVGDGVGVGDAVDGARSR